MPLVPLGDGATWGGDGATWGRMPLGDVHKMVSFRKTVPKNVRPQCHKCYLSIVTVSQIETGCILSVEYQVNIFAYVAIPLSGYTTKTSFN